MVDMQDASALVGLLIRLNHLDCRSGKQSAWLIFRVRDLYPEHWGRQFVVKLRQAPSVERRRRPSGDRSEVEPHPRGRAGSVCLDNHTRASGQVRRKVEQYVKCMWLTLLARQ